MGGGKNGSNSGRAVDDEMAKVSVEREKINQCRNKFLFFFFKKKEGNTCYSPISFTILLLSPPQRFLLLSFLSPFCLRPVRGYKFEFNKID